MPFNGCATLLCVHRQPGGREEGDVRGARDQQEQQPEQQGVPAINPRSRALAESSDLPQDFLTRQVPTYIKLLSDLCYPADMRTCALPCTLPHAT